MNRNDLTNLDVNKLFEDRSIDEITEIEKLLDAEIERKRNDLRSMVGDRYKDILAASDAIKSMKTISEQIVSSIDKITDTCEKLVKISSFNDNATSVDPANQKQKVAERTLLVQVRLAIFLNEQIWIALDNERNLDATQHYLLAQHVYIGLNLTQKDCLGHLPLLDQLKINLMALRNKILQRVTAKLESVEITAKETGDNLSALLLIENQTNDQLLSVFIEHRNAALQTVIKTQYLNMRLQVAAMVKCLVTTVSLLHDCFIYHNNKSNLLWEELNKIAEVPMLSKLELPETPLISYIPDIIKQFRPKLNVCNPKTEESKQIDGEKVRGWLDKTQSIVESGLAESLQLVTTVKGLYFIREEALKVELPQSWSKICSDLSLPENFDVWYYFFQKLITSRTQSLITTIIMSNLEEIKKALINSSPKKEADELDLRLYAWREDISDVSKERNDHTGLTMKTRGFSSTIVNLCQKIDGHFRELLEDVSQYLYGLEYSEQLPYLLTDYKFKRKFIDREELEKHIASECTHKCLEIPKYINDLIASNSSLLTTNSIFYARFLQACHLLCDNFRKCCEFDSSRTNWKLLCDRFTQNGHDLWTNWIDQCVKDTSEQLKSIGGTGSKNMLNNLCKWDELEIDEQAEEKVYVSQIKIPLKPSLPLTKILMKLTEMLGRVLPYTLPKLVHVRFIESNVDVILKEYETIGSEPLNQIQALQCLLDVRYLTTLCIPRENARLVLCAQNVCDKFRGKIDPFDLDVFYSHLQNNVRKSVSQSQTLFGCLLPSSIQLMNLGAFTKNKKPETEPSLLALSVPASNAWFPLLPITAPSQTVSGFGQNKSEHSDAKEKPISKSSVSKKSQDLMRQSAVSLFGNFSTDWFS